MGDFDAEEILERVEYRLNQIKCDLSCGIPKIENSYTPQSIVNELLRIINE